MEAKVCIPLLQDQVRSTIQRSPRGNRGILAYKNKFRRQQSRWKLVRWRRLNMLRQRNGKYGYGGLDLEEERCQRQLRVSKELTRNG